MTNQVLSVGVFLVLIPCIAAQSLSYDEVASAEYIWINQVAGATTLPISKLENWTCGLACDSVKGVHNARAVKSGLPLQTSAMIAEYRDSECLLAFQGSKTFLNYLLDDGNFVLTAPYKSCPTCKVHKGFYDCWLSLKTQILSELDSHGCKEKPIRLTGHSLGGAIAAIAVFDLIEQAYPIRHVYTYGQPRTGNENWVTAFQDRLASVPYFRVVDYKDPVARLPPRDFPKDKQALDVTATSGYKHIGPEVYYTATKMGQYKVCLDGEDKSCSSQFSIFQCISHGCCHCSYLGMNPCDLNQAAPACIEPHRSNDDLVELANKSPHFSAVV